MVRIGLAEQVMNVTIREIPRAAVAELHQSTGNLVQVPLIIRSMRVAAIGKGGKYEHVCRLVPRSITVAAPEPLSDGLDRREFAKTGVETQVERNLDRLRSNQNETRLRFQLRFNPGAILEMESRVQ